VPGAAADLAWLGDDLRTRAAWIGGELAYADPADRLAWKGPP